MKFELEFERVYPHPVAAVWRALTTRAALAQWLMDNDLVAEVGHEFHLLCADADDPHRFRCRVLELEPERRMVWSWVREDRPEAGEMRIELTLEPTPEGTRLRIRHHGEHDPAAVEKYRGGWPGNLERLASVAGDDHRGPSQ